MKLFGAFVGLIAIPTSAEDWFDGTAWYDDWLNSVYDWAGLVSYYYSG